MIFWSYNLEIVHIYRVAKRPNYGTILPINSKKQSENPKTVKESWYSLRVVLKGVLEKIILSTFLSQPIDSLSTNTMEYGLWVNIKFKKQN